MTAQTDPSNVLGDMIKSLLKVRGLKAYELSEEIGLSPTSVSKIINGVTRPRQNTFTRMCQVLCHTKTEERRLVAAFAGTELLKEEDAISTSRNLLKYQDPNRKLLQVQTEQVLERKAELIRFKNRVASELNKGGIAYQQDYCPGFYATDFLIDKDGKRIAVEAQYDALPISIEQVTATAELLRKDLPCDMVYTVVPYLLVDFKIPHTQSDAKTPQPGLLAPGCVICELSELLEQLSGIA